MNDEADAVVIGGGALGSSVAYHLTKLGRRVALIERFSLASQTSARAAGLTAQMRSTDVMTRLAMMSVRAIEAFEDDVGESIEFVQSGSLRVALTSEHERQLVAQVAQAQRTGLDVQLIAPSKAAELFPFLDSSRVRAVSYTPTDLYLEPAQLPLAYARAAGRLGAAVSANTEVTDVIVKDQRVHSVNTSRGPIRTPVVVDAAGAWSGSIRGIPASGIPMVPTRHQLLITDPIDGVEATLPICRIIDANVYVRPEDGGLMVGGYEPAPLQYDMAHAERDFQISELDLDLNVLHGLIASVTPQFPVLNEFGIRGHRGGLPTMTPDGEHILGPLPDVEGLFVATGCCVGGLSTSPALGQALAEWIVNGEPPLDLTALSPARFAGGSWNDHSELRTACAWQYAHHYSNRVGTETR